MARATRKVADVRRIDLRARIGAQARVRSIGAGHGLDGLILMAARHPSKWHSIPSNSLYTIARVIVHDSVFRYRGSWEMSLPWAWAHSKGVGAAGLICKRREHVVVLVHTVPFRGACVPAEAVSPRASLALNWNILASVFWVSSCILSAGRCRRCLYIPVLVYV